MYDWLSLLLFEDFESLFELLDGLVSHNNFSFILFDFVLQRFDLFSRNLEPLAKLGIFPPD